MAELRLEMDVPGAVDEVYAVLTSAHQVPFLFSGICEVDVVSGDAPLEVGAEYSFVFSFFGVGQSFRFHVDSVTPQRELVYHQEEGIYRFWRHIMKLESLEEGRTRVLDLVQYELPLGLLGHLLNDVVVRRSLELFLHRRLEKVFQIFSERQAL